MTVAKISFVIPTLNRGRYVVRAVDSCLAAETADASVEVVVLDSMSNDGSWELLNERFSADRRVILAQNQRGLGPTRSWLDGARLVTGDFVTFLWSDDYIGSDFLKVMLPHFNDGVDIVSGDGAVRDIDHDGPLPAGGSDVEFLDGDAFLHRHMGLLPGRPLPVSPAVALFRRALFDRWIDAVEHWCGQPDVRHAIMWKRAIGPDLMLFLAAATSPAQRVVVSDHIVAQFSSHAESITVSSSPWPLRAGYWLAKWWAVATAVETPRPAALAALARLVVQGLLLVKLAQYGRVANGVDPSLIQSFREAVNQARRRLFEIVGTSRGRAMLVTSSARLAWRMGARVVRPS